MSAPVEDGRTPGTPVVQVAVDTLQADQATSQVRAAVAAGAGRIELGRPLLDSLGLQGLRALVPLARGTTVVVDTMILAAPGRYVRACVDLGVQGLTVSALAPNVTVAAAVRGAEAVGLEMLVDLFNVAHPVERARECVALGARLIMVHFGVDQEATVPVESRLEVLREVVAAVQVPVAYATYSLDEAVSAARAGATVVVQGEWLASRPADQIADFISQVSTPRREAR